MFVCLLYKTIYFFINLNFCFRRFIKIKTSYIRVSNFKVTECPKIVLILLKFLTKKANKKITKYDFLNFTNLLLKQSVKKIRIFYTLAIECQKLLGQRRTLVMFVCIRLILDFWTLKYHT